MFGFGRKKKEESMNQEEKNALMSMSANGNGISKAKPRYSFDVKVYSMDENDKYSITEIQNNVLGNSEEEVRQLFSLSDQKVEFLGKREINPPASQPSASIERPTAQTRPPVVFPQSQPQETKYFTAGGIQFKMVGNEVFQKQWVRATQEELNSIRIVSDKSNKIISLDGKHIEIEHWIKVESDQNT